MTRKLPPGFEALAAQETAWRTTQFLAPVLPGAPIPVRILGVVVPLWPNRRCWAGWGVFQAPSSGGTTAIWVREATRREREQYLHLFPPIWLVISGRIGEIWCGRQAHPGTGKVHLTGDVPVRLTEEVQLLDTVLARYDGDRFWFDRIDRGRSRIGAQLRDLLARDGELRKIPDLRPVEGCLYREVRYARQRALEQEKRDSVEGRIRHALDHAGAVYQGYRELSDRYVVSYMVDGRPQQSVTTKDALRITRGGAGICLSGGDTDFDLASLVGVIREGMTRRQIVTTRIPDQENSTEDDDEL